MSILTVGIKEPPIHVKFKKTFYEDSYIEQGMEAFLVKVELQDDDGDLMYNLHFDCTEFMESNKKYLKDVYYENIHTRELQVKKEFYNAIEAGMYKEKISFFYGDNRMKPLEDGDFQTFHELDILNYIEVVESSKTTIGRCANSIEQLLRNYKAVLIVNEDKTVCVVDQFDSQNKATITDRVMKL